MKRNLVALIVFFMLMASSSYAAETLNVTGKIVYIQQKAHTRTLYYVVNTPITQDDPYFEVSVQIKDKIYTGEYAPRHSADKLPEAWKAEADVQVRLEKHVMFLKRPDGEEMEFIITRHTTAPASSLAPQTASPQK